MTGNIIERDCWFIKRHPLPPPVSDAQLPPCDNAVAADAGALNCKMGPAGLSLIP
jgi:hypothetical protein